MTHRAIVHLHQQIITRDVNYFTTFHTDLMSGRAAGCRSFCFHLCAHANREGNENRPHRQHQPHSCVVITWVHFVISLVATADVSLVVQIEDELHLCLPVVQQQVVGQN